MLFLEPCVMVSVGLVCNCSYIFMKIFSCVFSLNGMISPPEISPGLKDPSNFPLSVSSLQHRVSGEGKYIGDEISGFHIHNGSPTFN